MRNCRTLVSLITSCTLLALGCSEEFECCTCRYIGPSCDTTTSDCDSQDQITQEECEDHCANNLECGATEPTSAYAHD